MKQALLIAVAIVFFSCKNEESCDLIDSSYAAELESSLKKDNERMLENLIYSYGQFDMASALNKVTGMVANVDKVVERAAVLKRESKIYREDFDNVFVYNPDTSQIDLGINIVTDYKDFVLSLVGHDHFLKESLVEDINLTLDELELEEFKEMSYNQFRVEKERFKSKFIQVEYIVVEALLSELDYTKKEEVQ